MIIVDFIIYNLISVRINSFIEKLKCIMLCRNAFIWMKGKNGI